MKFKKLTAMLLATVITAGMANVGFAEEIGKDTEIKAMETVHTSDTDVKYKVDGGYIYINESTKTVTGADNEVTSVSIPNGVTSIADYAFDNCKYLQDIILPDSVTTIGKASFIGCYSLRYINIPSSVTTIGDNAFYYCYNLREITIPDGVKTIGSYTFCYCQSLKNISLPNSIKSIGNEAFLGCGSLTNIVIPNSINYISNYAFTGIGNNLNVYCYKNSIADNINLYNENYKINFIYLDNMETPTFASESLNEVSYKVDGGNIYFNTQTGTITDCDSSVTKVDIPEQINGIVVTSIGGYAFTHSKITEVNIPGSVQRIEKYAFYSCSELKKVSIQKGVKYIGEHAFFDCMVLRDITLSEGLETIDNGAFAWCGINAAGTEFNIIIPRTVNYIGNSVFYGTFINNLTFKNKNTVIAEDLFDSEYGKCYKIYCIKDSTAEKYAIINNIPYELIEEEPISIPVTGGNIYLNPATQQIVNCDNSVTTAAIPESIDGIAITGISDNAFANCAILESITIPTTITTISSSAFTNCTTLKTVYCEKASVADNASLYPAGVTIITDFPLGDVNCDGKVTKEDAQLVLDYVKDPNSTTISSKGIENMHVTTDGLITSYNAACIEEKAEKDNYKFEVE